VVSLKEEAQVDCWGKIDKRKTERLRLRPRMSFRGKGLCNGTEKVSMGERKKNGTQHILIPDSIQTNKREPLTNDINLQ
jgi:hypothetical protein